MSTMHPDYIFLIHQYLKAILRLDSKQTIEPKGGGHALQSSTRERRFARKICIGDCSGHCSWH
uniref:Uncharacterized protein n=1 Tax=Kalanchoe fedtschenkoi TaxID=63787 RepID=A0A7N0TG14_KALFE